MGKFNLFNHKRNFLIIAVIVVAILIVWTCQKEMEEGPASRPGTSPTTTAQPATPTPSGVVGPVRTPTTEPTATLVPGGLPHPDHIIFCFFENKSFTQIIGNFAEAPFINSLRTQGTLFTNSYAISHPSYPEYIRFFAGTANGKSDNNCVNTSTWTIPNLYTELAAVQRTFAWYSEDLPAMGSTICESGQYVERHNPTTLFANVPATANKPFSSFPTDYSTLENVVCITPNLLNDMHDAPIKQGDSWLQKLLPLIEWCKTHNSIFVIYYDEDNGEFNNRIPVMAIGEQVKANFELATKYDHYNWTRTICSMFNASTIWTGNVASRTDITGCWK